MAINLRANNILRNQLDSIPSSQGTDDWGSKFFLTTNEGEKERKLEALSKQPIVGNIVIGVSGMHTLNIAAIRGRLLRTGADQIQHILIFDRSLRVEHFWTNAQKIIAAARTRFGACLELYKLVLGNHEQYYRGNDEVGTTRSQAELWIQKMQQEFESGTSWLSSDESFHRIQKIFRENHFYFKRFDALDTEAFRALSTALQENGLKVDTLYVSNVLEYVEAEPEGVSKFRESMKHIIGEGTLVVDTKTRSGGLEQSEPLNERIRRCTDLGPSGAPVNKLFIPSPNRIDIEKIFALFQQISHKKAS